MTTPPTLSDSPPAPAARIPVYVALGVSFTLTAIIIALDLMTGPMINLAIFKTLPLLACAPARRRPVLWGLAAALEVLLWSVFLRELSTVDDPALRQAMMVNRGFAASTILIVAGILHVWIGADLRDLANREALARQNGELAAREEEIARQNEELQSQTEELERQSEELRFANEELTQRESMLGSLLDLSRALSVELDPDEMMSRICETLGQLVNGPTTAAAILVRDAGTGRLAVRCHSGFGPDGPRERELPEDRSFAGLVFGQLRTGYLEDVNLRPDLLIPQPKAGEPMVAILATPLVVRGKPFGTLEVYSRSRRSWGDQEIALIESLAAQTSISLETAELFAEVERERTRLRTVLETVQFGVAICDADCRNVRVNPAGAALLNVPLDAQLAPLGGDGRWSVYREGEALTMDQHPIVRAVRNREVVEPEELELVFASGKQLTLLVSAAPILDRDGSVIGGVACTADISLQKQLQRELDRRRREAEEASVRKTRFLAAASHDIRTPANAISLLAELIKRTSDNPAMSGEIPGLAEELQRSANSLVTLVSNVLDVTRFESGVIELHETEFPLAPLVAEEVRQVLPLAQNKGLTLTVEEPEDDGGDRHGPLRLRTDRVKLGRVLGNLLGNAIKFTDAGEVRIATRRVATGPAAGGVQVSVSDTGIGIDRAHQERIFDEFYQLTDPQRSKGSGLGLTICKRLVDAMGGTIRVDSEPGRGSTFSVTLPPAAILPATHAAAQGAGHSQPAGD